MRRLKAGLQALPRTRGLCCHYSILRIRSAVVVYRYSIVYVAHMCGFDRRELHTYKRLGKPSYSCRVELINNPIQTERPVFGTLRSTHAQQRHIKLPQVLELGTPECYYACAQHSKAATSTPRSRRRAVRKRQIHVKHFLFFFFLTWTFSARNARIYAKMSPALLRGSIARVDCFGSVSKIRSFSTTKPYRKGKRATSQAKHSID